MATSAFRQTVNVVSSVPDVRSVGDAGETILPGDGYGGPLDEIRGTGGWELGNTKQNPHLQYERG